MTVALNTSPGTRKPQRGSSSSTKITSINAKNLASRQTIEPNQPKNQQNLKIMPPPQIMPWWLRSLQKIEQPTSGLTFLVLVVTLTIYSWTVYSQRLWSQEYRKLENLQRQERQLSAASELLKKQMAQEAENPHSGLVPQKPEHIVFLAPAPPRPAPASAISPNRDRQTNHRAINHSTPLGY